MQPNQLWLVGALTGGGKTSIGLDSALAAARQGVTALYYSIEMSAESLTYRLLARMTGIDDGRIMRGKINKTELRKVQDAVEEMGDIPLTLFDSSLTSLGVSESALAFAEREPVGFIVVDYAQLLKDPVQTSDAERVGRISGNIRTLAMPDQLNIPIMLLSQFNRSSQSDGRIPRLHDFKGASDLEQDADIALILHRPYQQLMAEGAPPVDVETDAKIIIAKNRFGMTPATPAEFHTRTTTWKQF
jgi:replicative DNA helicase